MGKGLHEEIVFDSHGMEIGLIDQYHNGLSVVWTFEIAGGPQATLSYPLTDAGRKAAFFGMLRVMHGKSELISVKRAKSVAAMYLTKGAARVVNGKVVGIVTALRTEIVEDDAEVIYAEFDYTGDEVVFDAEDQLMIVE